MKKTMMATILASCMIFTAGCDNDDDSNGTSANGYTATIVVASKSQPPADTGAIKMYEGDGWQVLAGPGTAIQKQRESCSGFDNGGPEDVKNDDIIEFDIPDDATSYYPKKRTTPTWIRAYRSECLVAPHTDEPAGTNCTSSPLITG